MKVHNSKSLSLSNPNQYLMLHTTTLSKLINVLIVDDHQMIRDGIRTMLKTQEAVYRFNITEAESGEVAIVKSRTKVFDLAIVDCQLPGIQGDQTIEEIKVYNPQTKFLALSNYDEVSYIRKMTQSGAMGYVLKNIEPTQLISAIKNVLNNEMYYSSEVAAKLIYEEENGTKTGLLEKYRLTKREIEVLKMIAQEQTNDEIAEMLFISRRTVDTHRQNLIHKLRVKNTAGLTKAALYFKLI
jgi:DNA-binding NarL/FixJ family response regulator